MAATDGCNQWLQPMTATMSATQSSSSYMSLLHVHKYRHRHTHAHGWWVSLGAELEQARAQLLTGTRRREVTGAHMAAGDGTGQPTAHGTRRLDQLTVQGGTRRLTAHGRSHAHTRRLDQSRARHTAARQLSTRHTAAGPVTCTATAARPVMCTALAIS